MTAATWLISSATVLGVVSRPFGWPEAIWAGVGAVLLVALGSLGIQEAWNGVAKGFDVYLFLIGIMLLSETARIEGLFDWLASIATGHARGSPRRLFVLIYVVGILVTVLLSNDTTAVVLTPAVYAACRTARVKDPMPYLLICAFIANAASFVLPISNPANLVIFGGGTMPALSDWLSVFALPSLMAIVVTFVALYATQRSTLDTETVAVNVPTVSLSAGGKLAGVGLCATALMLVTASAFNFDLGLPTFLAGLFTAAVVLLSTGKQVAQIARSVSWEVLPLVAGLFVVVAALDKTGLINHLAATLAGLSSLGATSVTMYAASAVALASNLANNLPVGLVAGSAVQAADVSPKISAAILIGVDLGPNLSVTGSLATILWLAALRREGLHMDAWAFVKIGVIVMLPALVLAIACLSI
ncbi:arsenic transporter [Rhizobium sp. R693]|uniref:arsenic transporter n=1 Tax=Rhizobium sp. R693 TaxID=1764276 RepID=UPI000B52D2E3|nr:arsenic transporter [Rhizobium sp. R693]OWV99990.1 arsenic transporter [Rhizobium sp. R693]